jgi:predicted nucleotidyltransferase
MQLAGSGRGAVQRELARLLQSGLVTVKMLGTQKHYQANPASPLFDELCSIIQKTVGLAGPIRVALESLAELPSLAFIYGSVAQRTDSSDSDIDLIVVSDDAELEQIYAVLMPVERVLARPISLTLYTQSEYQQRLDDGNPFLERVLSGRTINLLGTIDVE